MFDIRQPIGIEDGEFDEELVQEYIEGIAEEFENSPDFTAMRANDNVTECGWTKIFLEYAFNYVGCTLTAMNQRDFDEVLFDLFPRKVSVGAQAAGEIIAELRGFFTFIARQYLLRNADMIALSLNDKAKSRLEAELGNSKNFGMAKSFFMLGKESGYDMTTPEGLAAFQLEYNERLAAAPMFQEFAEPYRSSLSVGYLPPLPADRPRGKALEKKRKDRKRQRIAKKKNRSR